MNQPISADSLSRIDKLFLDQDATNLSASLSRRMQCGIEIVAGDDIKASYGLQLALLTAINLGVKCFAGNATVHVPTETLFAQCLVPIAGAETLGAAIVQLGGKTNVWTGGPAKGRHIILGNATEYANSIRVTYDGWGIAVGPAVVQARLNERNHCPIAGMAAAAIAVGEVFAEFAGISITAARRVVQISLWRPDLLAGHTEWSGESISELPAAVGVFGLGHLGQAYLWGLASLRYPDPGSATILLCDDDRVETANVETGALLTNASISKLKTRAVSEWLETRGFSTRMVERRIDENFRRVKADPVIALSGFDDNHARRCLANAGFAAMFDSGLGGEAHNFDTIAFHAWPNPRKQDEIWRIESQEELREREARRQKQIDANTGYQGIEADECGRLLMAGKSVAVPFVGSLAASIILAEMLKAVNGGPVYTDITMRLCSTSAGQLHCGNLTNKASPILGVQVQSANANK